MILVNWTFNDYDNDNDNDNDKDNNNIPQIIIMNALFKTTSS